MKRQRRILIALGALAGLALVFGANFAFGRTKHRHRHQHCLPYFLIPREKVCGFRVVYANPDGSQVFVGYTTDLLPMPKPPQKKP